MRIGRHRPMPTVAPRIALIHALALDRPVNAELDRAWPGCVRMHLLDDSCPRIWRRAAMGWMTP
jgi:hypothetical protein